MCSKKNNFERYNTESYIDTPNNWTVPMLILTHTQTAARCCRLERIPKHSFPRNNLQMGCRFRCHDCPSSLHVRHACTHCLPKSLSNCDPSVAVAFAYLGDAVWEMYARQHMVLRSEKHSALGSQPVMIRPQEATKHGWCSSIAMCGHLSRLLEDRIITEEELDILKWGRDFGHETRSRHNCEHHREASALETLVAYLYLFDQQRLHFVMSQLGMKIPQLGSIVADCMGSEKVTHETYTCPKQINTRGHVYVSDLRHRVCMLEQRLTQFERASWGREKACI